MNVLLMMQEILFVAYPMVGESSLPDFALSANDRPKGVRISAFDQLDGVLQRNVMGRGQQQMNVLRHDDKCMQLIAAFAAIAIDRLQKEANVVLDEEKPSTLPSRKRDEIRPRRGD